MPTFNNTETGLSVRSKINNAITSVDDKLDNFTYGYGLVGPGTFVATTGSSGGVMNISAGRFIYPVYSGGSVSYEAIDYPGATDVAVQEVNNRVVSMYGMDTATGLLVQEPDFFTPAQIENGFIPGGVLLHFDKTNFTGAIGSQTLFAGNNLESYLINRKRAPYALNGCVYGFNANLTLNVTGGTMCYQGSNHYATPNTPHTRELPAQAVVGDGVANPGSSITGIYLDAIGDIAFQSFPAFEIDPNQWDDGTGTLAAMPSGNNWTIQPVLNSPITETTYIAYGREVFSTFEDASDAASRFSVRDLEEYPVWVPNGTGLQAVIVVKRGTTNLLSGQGTSTAIYLKG